MEFHSILGGAWLSAAHVDAEPGAYHALATWGVAPSGGLLAEIADNRGGLRRFVATYGWAAAHPLVGGDERACAPRAQS